MDGWVGCREHLSDVFAKLILIILLPTKAWPLSISLPCLLYVTFGCTVRSPRIIHYNAVGKGDKVNRTVTLCP